MRLSVSSALSLPPYLSFYIISPCFILFLISNCSLKLSYLLLLIYFSSSLVYESPKTHFPLELVLMPTFKTGHGHCMYMLNVC